MVKRLDWHLNIPGGGLGDDSGEGGLTGQPSTSVYVDVVTCSEVKVVHIKLCLGLGISRYVQAKSSLDPIQKTALPVLTPHILGERLPVEPCVVPVAAPVAWK